MHTALKEVNENKGSSFSFIYFYKSNWNPYKKSKENAPGKKSKFILDSGVDFI